MNAFHRTLVLGVSLGALVGATIGMAAGLADDPYALEGRAMREPGNIKVMLDAGRVFTRRYDESKQPDDLNKASTYLERATKLDPKNAEAMARYAIARGLQARDKNDKALAKQVLRELDQAVTLEPENPMIKSLRGYVEIEVPGDFNRGDQGLADLQAVDDQLKKDPTLKTKYDIDLAKFYFKLGKAYRAHGKLPEAKRAWEQAIAADPNSRDGQGAKKQLAKF